MEGHAGDRRQYRFGRFRLDSTGRLLERDGELLPLGPKVVETLTVLVENAGQVVDKDTLINRVWPDAVVAESSLTKNICHLRKVLDEGSTSSCIQTVARRGYRFVHSVHRDPVPLTGPGLALKARFGLQRRVGIGALVAIAAIVAAVAVWHTRNPALDLTDADRQYLVGRHIWNKMERSEVHRALSRFENAAKLNPRSPLAHSGIADSYVAMTVLGLGAADINLANARAAALRAVELRPRLALPHVSLGFVRLMADFDPNGAAEEFRRAIALDSDSAAAHFGYGILLAHSGRLNEARTSLDRACALDPVSVPAGVERGRTEFYARRYDRALKLLDEVLDREPASSQAHYYKAMSLRQLGRTAEALEHLHQARLHPNIVAEDEAWIQGVHDGGAASRKLLTERIRLVKENGAAPITLAVPAADSFDVDTAIAALEHMWRSRRIELLQLKVSPRWDPLRADERFIALSRRVWRD